MSVALLAGLVPAVVLAALWIGGDGTRLGWASVILALIGVSPGGLLLAWHQRRRAAERALLTCCWPLRYRTPGQARSLLQLLHAELGVAPYRATTALDQVLRWCDDPSDDVPQCFVLTGPTLSGKTRLTLELATRTRERRAVRLVPGRESDAWSAVTGVRGRWLVVAELADADPGALASFLRDCAHADDPARVRVLLVGRNPVPFRVEDDLAEAMLAAAGRLSLPFDQPDQARLKRAFHAALEAYSAACGVPAPQATWQAVPGDHIGLVNLRALALAVLRTTTEHPDLDDDPTTWVRKLADRELEGWHADQPGQALPQDRDACFAAAWVRRARTPADVRAAARTAVDPSRAVDAADWLWHRYAEAPDPTPTAGSSRPILRLPTDLVAAAIAVPLLVADSDLRRAVIDNLDTPGAWAEAAARVLSVASYVDGVALVRAIGRPIDAATVEALVARTPDTPEAIRRADAALTSLLDDPATDRLATEALIGALGDDFPHAQVAATAHLVTLLDALVMTDSDDKPTLARALDHYGRRLSEVDRPEEALEVTARAVQIYEQLAATNPVAYEADLARLLNGFSGRLAKVDRREEALEPSFRAVQMLERLSSSSPTYKPDLAESLEGYGARLLGVGRFAEALEPSERAVRIYDGLAATGPAVYKPNLAAALGNYSAVLLAMGRRAEALEANHQAARLYESLASENPRTYEARLARSLHLYGSTLMIVGRLDNDRKRRDEGLQTLHRSVQVFENLVSADRSYESELALMLGNYGTALSMSGRSIEALEPLLGAVQTFMRLSAEDPVTHEHHLAEALAAYAGRLSDVGRHQEALQAFRQAVQIYERLAATDPDAYEYSLANVLYSYGGQLSGMGLLEKGMKTLLRVVQIFEKLAAANGYYEPDLADALSVYSIHLARNGCTDRALAAIARSVEMFEHLVAAANPAVNRQNLANVRGRYIALLKGAGRDEEAEAARRRYDADLNGPARGESATVVLHPMARAAVDRAWRGHARPAREATSTPATATTAPRIAREPDREPER